MNDNWQETWDRMEESERRNRDIGEHRQLEGESLVEAAREREMTQPHEHPDEELLREALEALRGLLPFDGNGECRYCSGGSQVQEDGHHFDADNIWYGDPLCLNDRYYDDERATITKLEERLLRE